MKFKKGLQWQSLAIKQKLMAFTGAVFLIIVMTCLLDAWVVKFSLVDFYRILEENSRNSALVQALEEEKASFEAYVKNPDTEKKAQLDEIINETLKAVENLPMNYDTMGKSLYAKTWSVQNSYEVYKEKRDQILSYEEDNPDYIRTLYEVYDMQVYLLDYAQNLMTEGVERGNAAYHEKYPWMLGVPIIIIVLTLLFLYGIIKLSEMMNQSIIRPVIDLADASRKIASNEFFIPDVEVETQDEMGELVHAFNKMKYATGQYIQTLEEKRIALDKLYEKEVERLEMEKRLETAKMELLQGQINPHFLFNTLNVIGGMANLEEAEITEKMIKTLSDLFRYTLKNDQPVVPLTRELKVIEDYMYLQHMRFGARISYKISCEVDAEKIMVPTFTFQPLVENAIIHGLSPKVEGGKIKIRIWERKGIRTMMVADNGIGMPEATLCKLREEISKNEGRDMGIGFANVSRRMKAMYPEAKIEIFSKEHRGTVIKIQIEEG